MDNAVSVSVLLVTPSECDHMVFRRIFSHTNWTLRHVPTRREGMLELQRNPVPVVVCESHLPDGTWRDLLDWFPMLPIPPLMIVTSDSADTSLWAEVLNLGAYDFLAKPFNQSEVIQIVSLAWLYWREQTRRKVQPERARLAGGAAA